MDAQRESLFETVSAQVRLSKALYEAVERQRQLLSEQRAQRQALRGQLLAHRAALRLTMVGLRWAVQDQVVAGSIRGVPEADSPN